MNKLFLFIVICIFSSCSQEIEDSIIEKEVETKAEVKTSSIPRSIYVPDGYNYVWGDEFNGNGLDRSKWSYGLIPASQFGGVWHHTNDYENAVTPGDVAVYNGTLKLLAQENRVVYNGRVFNHTAGEISSRDSRTFNKCYVEVRCKWPKGKKVWPAIWMTAVGTWPPEFDLWEYFGDLNFAMDDVMQNNLWYNTYPNEENSYHNNYNFLSTYDAHNTYHSYGFEWTSEYAQWTIDGVVTRTINSYSYGDKWPNQDMIFILNHGLRAVSQWGDTKLPSTFEIGHARIYERPWDYNLMWRNAGFELGNSDAWSTYGGTDVYTGTGADGAHYGVCRNNYSGFNYTVYHLKPNTHYRFGGWVKSHGGARSFLCVNGHGYGQHTSAPMNSGSNQYHEIGFTTGPNSTSAVVSWYKYGDTGYAFGDKFRVYEVK